MGGYIGNDIENQRSVPRFQRKKFYRKVNQRLIVVKSIIFSYRSTNLENVGQKCIIEVHFLKGMVNAIKKYCKWILFNDFYLNRRHCS